MSGSVTDVENIGMWSSTANEENGLRRRWWSSGFRRPDVRPAQFQGLRRGRLLRVLLVVVEPRSSLLHEGRSRQSSGGGSGTKKQQVQELSCFLVSGEFPLPEGTRF
ncbi:hypothetical protein DPMN_186066 [Dreissena polymorpha]|uniref:Uncharacterized protein n=1 Tax=Dreissena polymorpha TaxID=45954 RepID=A0A9D4DNH0_DREPO|nr:hypothetical protein DPMN_186066 [Dreissena polymorpha]